MQYNGAGRGQYAATASRNVKESGFGGRAATYSYQNDPIARGPSLDTNRSGWRSTSAAQSGHQGVFLSSDGDSKSVSPIPFHRNDVVARHLLVETALLDSQDYELLPIEEVDALKKEKAQLETRLEATRRKLALESKVRDAAQSLHRLYLTKERPATPSSPKKRMSFLGERARSSSGNHSPRTANQAGDELATSQKKIDDLLQILSGLESRRQYVESRLLRHTAAVLQVAHDEESEIKSNGLHLDMTGDVDDSDRTYTDGTVPFSSKGSMYEESIYSNDRLDSMKDLGMNSLNGNSIKVQKRLGPTAEHSSIMQNEKVTALQQRLEGLNDQIRNLITEARSQRPAEHGREVDDIPTLNLEGEDTVSRLDSQAELLDRNVARLERELSGLKDDRGHEALGTKEQQHSIEGRLEEINNQLYILLTASRSAVDSYDAEPPPSAPECDAQAHLNYLEDSILALEDTLQQSGANEEAAKGLEDAKARAAEHADKVSEYDTTLRGVWDIISSGEGTYSLGAFSTYVQHMFDRASQHEVQMDTLRRQIQQQRELNSKSDGEKEREISGLHAATAEKETELVELRDRHVAAEAGTEKARAEMENVVTELERLKAVHETNIEQKQQVMNELKEHRQRAEEHETVVADYKAQLNAVTRTSAETEVKLHDHAEKNESLSRDLSTAQASREEAEARFQSKQEEMATLETEVVRLTTELTMAKAELDGAYGSRAERAKELTSAENEQLRKEKDDHAQRLQELTDKHATAEERSASLEAELAALKLKHAENESKDHDSSSSVASSRTAVLEKELAEMSDEYASLTRETVEAERERERLETLVDGLRERCEGLEAQISDERVRLLGMRSPVASVNGENQVGGGGARERETTSTAVLRSEFKKMMRETRAEGVRLLRVSFGNVLCFSLMDIS